MGKYILDQQFPQLIAYSGLKIGHVLLKAQLPEDLFARKISSVSSEEYVRLVSAIDSLLNAPGMAVTLATMDNVEQFSPVIFASYCSENGLQFLQRLRDYKPLIAPVRYRIDVLGEETVLYIESDSPEVVLNSFMSEGEIAFVLHIIRLATGEDIQPLLVETDFPVSNNLQEMILSEIVESGINAITFSTADMHKPFISSNEGMWNFFAPELQRRLYDIEVEDTIAARVRAALVELLPTGKSGIEDVARKLHSSSRSIQRKLSEEGTTFRKQLNHVRLLLAKQYLRASDMSIESIAFMLGYAESNSFARAFTLWTGEKPTEFRDAAQRSLSTRKIFSELKTMGVSGESMALKNT